MSKRTAKLCKKDQNALYSVSELEEEPEEVFEGSFLTDLPKKEND